jgi:hypothetical protein
MLHENTDEISSMCSYSQNFHRIKIGLFLIINFCTTDAVFQFEVFQYQFGIKFAEFYRDFNASINRSRAAYKI